MRFSRGHPDFSKMERSSPESMLWVDLFYEGSGACTGFAPLRAGNNFTRYFFPFISIAESQALPLNSGILRLGLGHGKESFRDCQ